MSYDAELEVVVLDGGRPDLARLRNRVHQLLDAHGIHHDVFLGLVDAFTKARGHFRVHPAYLLFLLDELAPLISTVSFEARGLGEEFRHTWIAEYRQGKRIYTQGPWEYDDEAIQGTSGDT